MRIVSITRTCQPASAMLPPELAPIRVGLDCLLVVYQNDELRNLDLGHTQSK